MMSVADIFSDITSRAVAGAPADVLKLSALLSATRSAVFSAARDGGASAADASAASDSPSACLGAALSALERSGAVHARELCFLLARLARAAPEGAVAGAALPAAALLTALLSAPAAAADEPTLRAALGALGAFLARGIEHSDAAWSAPPARDALAALLAHAFTGSRAKPRRAAADALVAVCAASATSRSVAGPCISAATAAASALGRRDERALALAASLLLVLTPKAIALLAPAVVEFASQGPPRAAGRAWSSIAALASAPRTRLSVRFCAALVNATANAAPRRGSPPDAIVEYAAALSASAARLASTERRARGIPLARPALPGSADGVLSSVAPDASYFNSAPLFETAAALPTVVQALCKLFVEPLAESVHAAVAGALAVALAACIDGAGVTAALAHTRAAAGENVAADEGAPSVARALCILAGDATAIAASPAWPSALSVFSVVFRLLGVRGAPLAVPLVLALVSIRAAVAAAASRANAAAVALEDAAEDAADEEFADRARAAKMPRRGRGRDNVDTDESGSEGDVGGKGDRGRSRRSSAAARGRSAANDAEDGAASAPTAARALSTVDGALAAAIQSFGVAVFSQQIGLVPRGGEVPESLLWSLPLMRSAGDGAATFAPMQWWTLVIAPLANAELAASSKAAGSGGKGAAAARAHRARAAQLWALLPLAFDAPTDTRVGLNETVLRLFRETLNENATGTGPLPAAPRVIAAALARLVAHAREATGLPSLSRALVDEASDEALIDADAVDEGSDDEDDEGDEMDDGGHKKAGAWTAADDDGATTVFGAGGVSVYAFGADANAEASNTHPVIAACARRSRTAGGPRSWPSASDALAAVGVVAPKLLPILFDMYEKSLAAADAEGAEGAARGSALLDAVAAITSVASPALSSSLVSRLLSLLETARTAANSADAALATARRDAAGAATEGVGAGSRITAAASAAARATTRVCSLLGLASAIAVALPAVTDADCERTASPASPVALLNGAALPSLGSAAALISPRVQKRGYALLALLLRAHPSLVSSRGRLASLWTVLRDSAPLAAPPARRARLAALARFVKALDIVHNESHRALLPPIVRADSHRVHRVPHRTFMY